MTETTSTAQNPPLVRVGLTDVLDAALNDLISEWWHIARIASRDGDIEKDERGQAYLRAKFWAYFNCATRLAEAIGKPIPIPDQLMTDQQISEAIERHQKPLKLPSL